MSRNVKEAFWYLIPSIILFLVFFYWPLIQNIYLSFFSWNMVSPTMKYVGLKNFTDILASPELIKIMINTVFYVGFMLILIFVLPYFYSYILGHLIQRW
ncbi:MAG: sugar ABC transporter permease, partial [Phascolarctobacterium sp.]|nr:sugar ABC transporter permease [Phascolarctobacterium sp.]